MVDQLLGSMGVRIYFLYGDITWFSAVVGGQRQNHKSNPGSSTIQHWLHQERCSFPFGVCSGWVQRRQWHPTPVLLPGKSHGRRRLVGCSPWGRWESDTTERLHFDFSLSRIGEGNGNPLQCSCLENPRDGGAWWTAISGVTQNQTRLKWLSSSSSSGWVGEIKWINRHISTMYLI